MQNYEKCFNVTHPDAVAFLTSFRQLAGFCVFPDAYAGHCILISVTDYNVFSGVISERYRIALFHRPRVHRSAVVVIHLRACP